MTENKPKCPSISTQAIRKKHGWELFFYDLHINHWLPDKFISFIVQKTTPEGEEGGGGISTLTDSRRADLAFEVPNTSYVIATNFSRKVKKPKLSSRLKTPRSSIKSWTASGRRREASAPVEGLPTRWCPREACRWDFRFSMITSQIFRVSV